MGSGWTRVARSRLGSLMTFIALLLPVAPLVPSGAHDHLVAVDRDLVGAQPLARIALQLAIRQAPVPMMPGTAHHLLRDDDLAVAERGALVRTGVVDREKIVAEAEHGDRARSSLHGDRRPGRNVVDLADHIFGHFSLRRTSRPGPARPGHAE